MDTTDLNQLIRLAQVLTVRCRLLSHELEKAERGPQSKAALKAADFAAQAEAKLNRIMQDILAP